MTRALVHEADSKKYQGVFNEYRLKKQELVSCDVCFRGLGELSSETKHISFLASVALACSTSQHAARFDLQRYVILVYMLRCLRTDTNIKYLGIPSGEYGVRTNNNN